MRLEKVVEETCGHIDHLIWRRCLELLENSIWQMIAISKISKMSF